MKNQFYIILFISNLFAQVDYNTQIQPIFDNNCISCHNNGGGYAGNLDLSSYENVLAGGNSNNNIIPNDHLNSLLYERITLPEQNQLSMPQFGSSLPESDITLISQWIDQGALETPADVYCYADDGTDGVMFWETCYSIENTTALGWPLSIPDSATSLPMNLFSLTNLITLNITNSNISEPIQPEIEALVNLTKLNLSHNQISGEIPSEIGNLINLTSLNLNSNQLSGNIPIEIFNISNLKGEIEPAFIGTVFYPGLDLSNNLLNGSIPEQLGLLENLKSIDLSYNQLTGDLPVELYSLDSLQSLNLSNNLLSGEISQEIGNLLNLKGITTYAHNSSVLYDALNLSNNLFTGSLPESICDLPLDWDDDYMNQNQGFNISDNQFCAPFHSCVEPFIGIQDTSNCTPLTSQIEGRWLAPVILGQTANTMYEFIDDLRYTYYCSSDTNGCDSSYWNSLDTSNAIPNPNPYTFFNDTLTIDISYGNIWKRFATFECDGYVVSLSDPSFGEWNWHRVGFNTSECENQELSFSHITNAPENFRLNQNYPNPFNPTTQIKYDLAEASLVAVTVYDITGRMVKNLVNASKDAGYHSLRWDATNNIGEAVSAGMYIYKIQAGEYRSTKKMVLLK